MYSKSSPMNGATATMTTTSIIINNPRALAIDIPSSPSAPNLSSSNDSLLLTTPIIIHGISASQGILASRRYTSSHASSTVNANDLSTSTSSTSVGHTNGSNSTSSLEPNTDTPTITSPALNVKFAPLPQLGPRKRKSSVPLGIAARGQLVRRRRTLQDHDDEDGTRPIEALDTSGEKYKRLKEEQELARMQRKRRAKVHYRERDLEGSDQEFEDPFIQFGKIVKGAFQSSWKKVSQSKEGSEKVREKEREKEKEKEKEKEAVDEDDSVSHKEKREKKKEKAKERNRERKKSVDTWREKNGPRKPSCNAKDADRGRKLSRESLGMNGKAGILTSPSPSPAAERGDSPERSPDDRPSSRQDSLARGDEDAQSCHRPSIDQAEPEPRRSESDESNLSIESEEGEKKSTVNGSVEGLLLLSSQYANRSGDTVDNDRASAHRKVGENGAETASEAT